MNKLERREYMNKLEQIWKHAPSKYGNNNTRTTTKERGRVRSLISQAIQSSKKIKKKSGGKEQGTDMF
jgi:Skp family chaperone for outer membrane proteins